MKINFRFTKFRNNNVKKYPLIFSLNKSQVIKILLKELHSVYKKQYIIECKDISISKRHNDTFLAICSVVIKKGKKTESKKFYLKSIDNRSLSDVYRLLVLLNKSFSKSNFKISKPISYVNKYNLLIEEELDGDVLTTLKDYDFDRVVLMMAEFLKKMHSINIPKKEKEKIVYAENIQFSIGKTLVWYVKYYPETPSYYEFLASSVKVLAVGFNKYVSREKYCFIHGDFGSYNILLSNDAISVIDFVDVTIGDSANDIALMIFSLCYFDGYFVNNWSKKKVAKKKDLIKSYFNIRNGDNLDTRVDLFLAFHLLRSGVFIWRSNSESYKVLNNNQSKHTLDFLEFYDELITSIVKKDKTLLF